MRRGGNCIQLHLAALGFCLQVSFASGRPAEPASDFSRAPRLVTSAGLLIRVMRSPRGNKSRSTKCRMGFQPVRQLEA